MDDLGKCLAECRERQGRGREISDGCARTIAAMYHEPGFPAGPAFSTSGAIPEDPMDVWHALFGRGFYSGMTMDEKLLADMLGTYLIAAGPRGPVPGWSSLWVE